MAPVIPPAFLEIQNDSDLDRRQQDQERDVTKNGVNPSLRHCDGDGECIGWQLTNQGREEGTDGWGRLGSSGCWSLRFLWRRHLAFIWDWRSDDFFFNMINNQIKRAVRDVIFSNIKRLSNSLKLLAYQFITSSRYLWSASSLTSTPFPSFSTYI